MVKRFFILFIVLGLLIGGLVWFKQHQVQQQAAMQTPPPPATVTATEAVEQVWRPRLQAVGTVTAIQGIEVSSDVAGLVREINFESGQQVAQGDVLLKLDDDVDQADLRGLQSELELARLRFERVARLIKERSVSQSDYDTAQAELASARAHVASKQASIAKKVIRAPFDGTLGLRAVSLGQFLPAGSSIAPLVKLDPVYVDFSLPERYLPQLAVGLSVQISVQSHQQTFNGRLAAIDPDVDASTRQIRMRAEFRNPEALLRPGMFAGVTLDLGRSEAVLTVPRVAVTYAPYGDAVYVIEEADGKLSVQQRQVRTGSTIGERVVVESGLSAGERVVLTGQVKLRNGAQVRVDNTVVPDDAGAAAQ
jgi:membrane fusion protein (multidrug efflux system)